EAFGKTLPNEDPDGDGNKFTLNLRFPGQYYDVESGLHYNHHRYYSPKLGRYMSADPIGLAGGLNLFGYAKQNPLRYVDPLGLFHYNNPDPTVTTPVTGPTRTSLECLEQCVRGRTPENVDLRVSGGGEAKGHSRNSEHPKATACDISGPQRNRGMDNADMFDCAKQCGFGAGQFERFTRTPGNNHWHFQIFPSNGVPAMPGNPSALSSSPYDMGSPFLKTIPR
ncbi:MAG: RHS repeat-associated core domain-containing protein, partial [Sulfuricellaceae bacterium]|nr:RHS repeat-associated core domain-containing protein [Sulfuricellaceae bacterium]